MKIMDCGPNPFVANVKMIAEENDKFRVAIWTGGCVQMTLMCIEPHDDIGMEVHEDTDQIIRVECGRAMVKMGKSPRRLECCKCIEEGDVVFVPAGTWHDIINTEDTPLKLSSVYAPPHHPRGTVHCTKADAED